MNTFARIFVSLSFVLPVSFSAAQDIAKPGNSIRIATYNVALNRKKKGELVKELEGGESSQAKAVAKVIQIVRPDVLLINELDYADGKSAKLMLEKYLSVPQGDQKAMEYKYHFAGPVNTGVDSGLDYDNNGKMGEPNDALGFGYFPGQYAMAVYSVFSIETEDVRTFQNFLWKDMPGAVIPIKKDGKNYYSEDAMAKFRLSSKSHWDLPIKIGEKNLHFLVCHPTPPVFDGPEDKNGCRNHDEIRLWSDYVSGKAEYLYDDAGKKGGLKAGEHFVVAGDLNADPVDGDSRDGAINLLLNSEMVNAAVAPKSTGGRHWADTQGGANAKHKGDPAMDTADFNDKRVGNMRIDYVVPSKSLKIINSGVFWPKPDEPGEAEVKRSDHRLVWIDIEK